MKEEIETKTSDTISNGIPFESPYQLSRWCIPGVWTLASRNSVLEIWLPRFLVPATSGCRWGTWPAKGRHVVVHSSSTAQHMSILTELQKNKRLRSYLFEKYPTLSVIYVHHMYWDFSDSAVYQFYSRQNRKITASRGLKGNPMYPKLSVSPHWISLTNWFSISLIW